MQPSSTLAAPADKAEHVKIAATLRAAGFKWSEIAKVLATAEPIWKWPSEFADAWAEAFKVAVEHANPAKLAADLLNKFCEQSSA